MVLADGSSGEAGMRNGLSALGAALCLLLAATPALAGNAVCDRLDAATAKMKAMPRHQTIVFSARDSRTGTDREAVTETITVDGASYVKIADTPWRKDAGKPAKPDAPLVKTRCEMGGTDVVGGEPTDTVLAWYDTGKPGMTMSDKTWISQKTGLIVKSEMDLSSANVLTIHTKAVYDYADIKAPEIP
jgi:hypothetical protein